MTIKKRIRIALALMIVLPMMIMFAAVGITKNSMEEHFMGILPEHRPFEYAPRGRGEPFALVVLIGVLVSTNGLLSWWVASGVMGPLRKLNDATNRIGEGDLDFALDVRSSCDEFRELGNAFSLMQGNLRESLKRQNAEERSRKEIIAHISHDLRTPISAIRGYAEGIRDGVAATAEARARYVEIILDNAERLDLLIESFFTYSKLDVDGIDATFKPVDMADFVRSFAARYEDDSLAIVIGPGFDARDRTVVNGDLFLIDRVFSNLAENSSKHAARGPTEILISATVSRDTLGIVFSDNGNDFPREKLSGIFTPFFRADESRHSGGSGLGLSIVRKIMQAHGGDATARISPSGGLEIALSFPLEGARE